MRAWRNSGTAIGPSAAPTPFENDIAVGVRLAVNDAASTEALLAMVQDLDTSARFLILEANRRFGDHWLLTAELSAFLDQTEEDFLFDARDDELMQIQIAYCFQKKFVEGIELNQDFLNSSFKYY